MGLLDTLGGLKDRLLGGDDYYDDYDDDYADDEYVDDDDDDRDLNAAPRSRSTSLTERRNGSGVLGNSARPEAESVSVYTRSGERVASEPSPSTGGYTTPTSFAGDAFGETVQRNAPTMLQAALPPSVLKPQTYNDIQSVIRRVRSSQAVVLDLRRTPIDAAKRILDFSFGLACGIDGSVEELDDRVFCVLPRGIGLSGSDTERLVREGILRR